MQETSRRASRVLPAMPEQDNGQQTAQLRRQLQEQTTEIATLKVISFPTLEFSKPLCLEDACMPCNCDAGMDASWHSCYCHEHEWAHRRMEVKRGGHQLKPLSGADPLTLLQEQVRQLQSALKAAFRIQEGAPSALHSTISATEPADAQPAAP